MATREYHPCPTCCRAMEAMQTLALQEIAPFDGASKDAEIAKLKRMLRVALKRIEEHAHDAFNAGSPVIGAKVTLAEIERIAKGES